MKFENTCKNCEFNFDGTCAGHGNTYKYGDKITDDTKSCDGWGASYDYFCYITNKAPRFLRETYNDCKIGYDQFCTLLENYCEGKPIKINFFDAIKMVYGISMVDIAVVLDVSYGVVYRAKTQGFAPKRLKQFAVGLCVPEKFLYDISTSDLSELKQCKNIFFSNPEIGKKLDCMPAWKLALAHEISAEYLNCPIHIAKIIARVDKIVWTAENSKDEYTESEQVLINYVSRGTKKYKPVHSLEYSIGMSGHPNIKTRMMIKEG
ncbi:MAG: hypothetical protein RR954_07530 [Christensenellaceae bacterium]